MSKLILFLSFVSLAILTIGSLIDPNSPAMWLAASQTGYNVLRLGLIAVLFALMVTNPPRHRTFRGLVGIAAVILTSWTLWATYNNSMKLLDSASILAASVSMGIVALEYDHQNEKAEQLAPRNLQLAKRSHPVAH